MAVTPDRLRQMADAATSGGWMAYRDGDIVAVCTLDGDREVLPWNEGAVQPRMQDAALIAALGPDAARLLADAMDFAAHMEKHWGGGIAGSKELLARFAALGEDS